MASFDVAFSGISLNPNLLSRGIPVPRLLLKAANAAQDIAAPSVSVPQGEIPKAIAAPVISTVQPVVISKGISAVKAVTAPVVKVVAAPVAAPVATPVAAVTVPAAAEVPVTVATAPVIATASAVPSTDAIGTTLASVTGSDTFRKYAPWIAVVGIVLIGFYKTMIEGKR